MRLRLATTQILLAGLACISIVAGAADFVVVAGAGSGIVSLSREQVAELFLGKTHVLPTGGKAILIDQPESSELRDAFYTRVTGKSAAQVRSTWAKLAFTGKGTPPLEGAGNDGFKKQVAGNRNMLGYIDKSALDGSVKAVYAP
jgi:ABC-type phosphate transport system substrate-binding protein